MRKACSTINERIQSNNIALITLHAVKEHTYWTIRGDQFFVGFSTKHKVIQSDIWITISTNWAI